MLASFEFLLSKKLNIFERCDILAMTGNSVNTVQ